MLVHAVRRLRECPSVGPVVVAAPADEVEQVAALLSPYGVVVVAGGRARQDSVAAGLAALPEVTWVLVHDAARALVPVEVVEAVVAALRAGAEAVVPVVPVADTVKRVSPDGRVVETVPREDLRAVQTPQGFLREVLVAAHAGAGGSLTDDAGLVEALGRLVETVPGDAAAFKVTTPFDLLVAEAVLSA
jgi:2-C-methyl-D-erythritol 4-phosphate cytidylyltransferase